MAGVGQDNVAEAIEHAMDAGRDVVRDLAVGPRSKPRRPIQESPPGWEGSDLGSRWWRGIAAIKPLETFGTPKPLVSEPAQSTAYAAACSMGPAQPGVPRNLAVTATFGFGARRWPRLL